MKKGATKSNKKAFNKTRNNLKTKKIWMKIK